MSEYKPLSSANTEPQLLLESGPMTLRDFNPKAVLHFQGRKCVTCGNEIMDHWLVHDESADVRGLYWCDVEAKQWSEGIADAIWDVPKEMLVSKHTDSEIVCEHTEMRKDCARCAMCNMSQKEIVENDIP